MLDVSDAVKTGVSTRRDSTSVSEKREVNGRLSHDVRKEVSHPPIVVVVVEATGGGIVENLYCLSKSKSGVV